MKEMKKKVHLVSLGCAKNLVDSEVMLGLLEQAGYRLVDDPAEADVLLINTCGFIRPAVEEGVDEILRLAAYKEEDPGKILVVAGCMVQRYGQELQREMPEVDLLVGVDELSAIDRLLTFGRSVHRAGEPSGGGPTWLVSADIPRRLSTGPASAFVKITDGCDNHCAYCLIPSIRGTLRSRPLRDVITEIRRLTADGVVEINLIAQDLTGYGRDLAGGPGLEDLLRGILAETEVRWLRLLYLYPASVSTALLRLMAEEPRILPYLDIPFQHVSDRVLSRMGRRYDRARLDELVETIRSLLPGCTLRTTLLLGFPGETERDLQEVLDALAEWRLDHVGVFSYQDEEECAAHALPDKVPEQVAEERVDRVMELQAAISAEKNARLVGREKEVLVEGMSLETDLLLQGRLKAQAPEVDGCVYINDGVAAPGEIVRVRITESHTYDLVGGIVSGPGE